MTTCTRQGLKYSEAKALLARFEGTCGHAHEAVGLYLHLARAACLLGHYQVCMGFACMRRWAGSVTASPLQSASRLIERGRALLQHKRKLPAQPISIPLTPGGRRGKGNTAESRQRSNNVFRRHRDNVCAAATSCAEWHEKVVLTMFERQETLRGLADAEHFLEAHAQVHQCLSKSTADNHVLTVLVGFI